MAIGWACFRNYVEHAEEIGGDITDYPRFFIMPNTSHKHSDKHGNNMIKLMDDSEHVDHEVELVICLLYTSPSPRDQRGSRMPSSA